MKIADLEKSGGFVNEPVKRPIKWGKHEGDVYVRQVSFATVAATMALPDAERSVALIHECIRLGTEGDEQLTMEQAGALSPALAAAFMNAITEVTPLEPADPLD